MFLKANNEGFHFELYTFILFPETEECRVNHLQKKKKRIGYYDVP